MTPQSPETLGRVRRGLRLVVWLLGLFAIFGVTGALLGPPIARHVMETTVSEHIGRKVTVESISVNPYALTATLNGLSIAEAGGKGAFFTVEQVYADAELSSIFRAAPVLASLRVTAPRIKLARNEDKSYSISDIIEKILAKPASPEPAKFALSNIVIERGEIDFDDRPEKTLHKIRELKLAVPFVSSLSAFAKDPVQPSFSALVNGAPLELRGDTRPFLASLDSELKLDISRVNLKTYFDYLPVKPGVELVSGQLGAKLALSFRRAGAGIAALSVSGSADLDALELKESKQQGGRTLLKLPRLALEFGPVDIVGREVHIASIKAEGLDLALRRAKDGRLNIAALGAAGEPPKPNARAGAASAADKSPAKPFIVDIKSIALDGGRIAFVDEMPEQSFQTTAEKVSLKLENLSTREAQTGRMELAFSTQAGESVGASGTFSIAPLNLDLALEIGKLKLAGFAPYYARQIKFQVADGALDIKSTLKHDATNTQVRLLELGLSGLRLTRDGADWTRLGSLLVRDADIDLGKRSLNVGELTVRDGSTQIRRDKDGRINLADLVVQGAEDAKPAPAPASTPWTMALKKLNLDKLAASWEDLAGGDPVRLAIGPVNLEASGLSTQAGTSTPFKLAAGVGRGRIAAGGELKFMPLSGQMDIDAQGLEFLPLQPYFAQFVNITLTSGAAGAKGKLVLDTLPGGALRSSFTGDASINDFASVDKLIGEPFLRWKSLAFSGLAVRTEPFALELAQIAAADFYSRLIVTPDGKVNVQGLVVTNKDAAPAASAPAPNAPSPAVRIGKVTLSGGRVDFSDRYIKPNYSARITDLGGLVSGLSAEQASRADLELKGRIEGSAPIDISGKLNPLAKDPFLDIQAKVRGMELSPFSPYSGRYVGYGIEKGKLTLDLHYHLENRKLEASNKIFLDQLTFGAPVESPDALKIPVLLAVALLKNSRGEIDIELPVSGSLDDPQFSIGGLVVKVIVNLIVKAVTSPFALLGSLFGGGGGELSYVEFAPGFANLSEAAEMKLKSLAKALNDRPGLKLEMSGQVDEAADRDGLKRRALAQKVRAQKVAELVRRGTAVASNAEVRVEPAEYEEYLKRAYDRESFAKPRNAIGLARALPKEEMEKLMLANISVGEDELRALAQRRSQAVKNWLEKSGEVADERIFLVAGKPAGGEEAKGAPPTRVDLFIK